MQWSRLKKEVESRFAPSVAGRVELRTTNYRQVHDWEGRGWITIDKEEVHNFCTLKYWVERNKLLEGFQDTDWREPAQRAGYERARDEAEGILEKRGVLSQGWFENSLQEYLSLTIEDALASPNFLHRGLAIVDKRFGKRRLKSFEPSPTDHALVSRLLELRRAAEARR